MKNNHYDVVIVGSGLAGLAAANEFSQLGVNFLVIEENYHLGGQLIRQQPDGTPLDKHQDQTKKAGYRLAQQFAASERFIRNARILGVFDDNKVYLEQADGQTRLIESDYILLATGAREKFMPFKGWTLPGVLSLGGSQVMMKSSGILPGKQTVVAGGGPLLYVLSGQILRHGGQVPLILDRASLIEKMQFLKLMPPQWSKLSQVMHDMTTIITRSTPMRNQHAVVEARGEGRVEEVVYAKIDKLGRAITGTEHTVSADSLAIGQGLVANTELAAGAGCELSFVESLGGWIVNTDERLKTTQKHIYAAGEITGIGGGEQSLHEGQLAALQIAIQLGRQPANSAERVEKLQAFRRRQRGFSRFLADLSRVPGSAWQDVSNDTIICRCEDISMGDVRRAMDLGLDSVNLFKRGTRMGMGRCQGRTCVPLLNDILQANDLQGAPASTRFPVKPVNLTALRSFGDE